MITADASYQPSAAQIRNLLSVLRFSFGAIQCAQAFTLCMPCLLFWYCVVTFCLDILLVKVPLPIVDMRALF